MAEGENRKPWFDVNLEDLPEGLGPAEEGAPAALKKDEHTDAQLHQQLEELALVDTHTGGSRSRPQAHAAAGAAAAGAAQAGAAKATASTRQAVCYPDSEDDALPLPVNLVASYGSTGSDPLEYLLEGGEQGGTCVAEDTYNSTGSTKSSASTSFSSMGVARFQDHPPLRRDFPGTPRSAAQQAGAAQAGKATPDGDGQEEASQQVSMHVSYMQVDGLDVAVPVVQFCTDQGGQLTSSLAAIAAASGQPYPASRQSPSKTRSDQSHRLLHPRQALFNSNLGPLTHAQRPEVVSGLPPELRPPPSCVRNTVFAVNKAFDGLQGAIFAQLDSPMPQPEGAAHHTQPVAAYFLGAKMEGQMPDVNVIHLSESLLEDGLHPAVCDLFGLTRSFTGKQLPVLLAGLDAAPTLYTTHVTDGPTAAAPEDLPPLRHIQVACLTVVADRQVPSENSHTQGSQQHEAVQRRVVLDLSDEKPELRLARGSKVVPAPWPACLRLDMLKTPRRKGDGSFIPRPYRTR